MKAEEARKLVRRSQEDEIYKLIRQVARLGQTELRHSGLYLDEQDLRRNGFSVEYMYNEDDHFLDYAIISWK